MVVAVVGCFWRVFPPNAPAVNGHFTPAPFSVVAVVVCFLRVSISPPLFYPPKAPVFKGNFTSGPFSVVVAVVGCFFLVSACIFHSVLYPPNAPAFNGNFTPGPFSVVVAVVGWFFLVSACIFSLCFIHQMHQLLTVISLQDHSLLWLL